MLLNTPSASRNQSTMAKIISRIFLPDKSVKMVRIESVNVQLNIALNLFFFFFLMMRDNATMVKEQKPVISFQPRGVFLFTSRFLIRFNNKLSRRGNDAGFKLFYLVLWPQTNLF